MLTFTWTNGCVCGECAEKQVIDTGDMMLLATPNVMDFVTVQFFTIDLSKSDRSDIFRMFF